MLELNHGFRVVDAHARLDPGADAAETLERECRQAGVVQAVVFAESSDGGPAGYVRANNAVARGAANRPLLPFARLSGPRAAGTGPGNRLRNLAARPTEAHAAPDDVEQYAYGDRFHGFVLDPARDGLPTEAVLGALEDAGLPVLVRAGVAFPPAAAAEQLLGRSFPVVLAHFGGYPLREDLMREAVELLDAYDDCYLDTCAVRSRRVIESAVREHPDRVLFGSGAPTVHPNVGVMEVLTLDLPEDEMRRVFWRNAARLVPALAPDG